jgi:citrate lyase subunit beta/citryl-CoA lyase
VPAVARTLLFVPGDQPRRLARAWTAPADAVIVDLEDAVAPDRKQAAREIVEEHVAARRPDGALVLRVNALDTEDAAADLALAGRLDGMDAVMVPKARASQLTGMPLPHPVIALIETSAGVLEAEEIAKAPGVVRLMLGTVDLAAELGIDITPHSPLFAHARAVLALASAAAGLPGPIDGVWTGVRDEAGLRAEALAAKAAGFTGKACVHPDQLAPAREVFLPTAEQLQDARRIVEAAQRALGEGRGAISLDGRMIDLPVLERARRLLNSTERTRP